VSAATVRDWTRRRGIEIRDLDGEDNPQYGESRDESAKEAISVTLSGRDVSNETREAIADANRGRTPSPETRARIAPPQGRLPRTGRVGTAVGTVPAGRSPESASAIATESVSTAERKGRIDRWTFTISR